VAAGSAVEEAAQGSEDSPCTERAHRCKIGRNNDEGKSRKKKNRRASVPEEKRLQILLQCADVDVG
jgi:hypothetical protein